MVFSFVIFALIAQINQMWYALPLVVAVSLVYSATRHEEMRPILEHAFRLAWSIFVFMGVILLVLWVISWLVSG
jgi:heme/copper-type cytochrome/quinol oxidase subunit 2